MNTQQVIIILFLFFLCISFSIMGISIVRIIKHSKRRKNPIYSKSRYTKQTKKETTTIKQVEGNVSFKTKDFIKEKLTDVVHNKTVENLTLNYTDFEELCVENLISIIYKSPEYKKILFSNINTSRNDIKELVLNSVSIANIKYIIISKYDELISLQWKSMEDFEQQTVVENAKFHDIGTDYEYRRIILDNLNIATPINQKNNNEDVFDGSKIDDILEEY